MSGSPVVLDVRVVRGTGGGPDKTILNSPRFLAPWGYRTLCAYMHPPGDPGFDTVRQRAARWGAPLLSIPDRGAWDWRVVAELLRICFRERVAVWHGHDYKSNLIGLLIRRAWPMRLVTTVHGWGVIADRRTQFYYWIDRLCLRHYEHVICVSEDLRERCLASGVLGERCVVIENSIDTRQFSRERGTDEAKARLGISPHRQVIGAVGRLSAEKNFELLIRAVDRLLASGHDLELLIVGEGSQESRLRELIAGLGREDRVRLLGFRADTHDLYQAMDVFALTSLREGLPNAVLEAMAMEVPVVSTRIAGIPRLIRHEENGLLVAPGSVDELVPALARLLESAEVRDRLRHEGRRTIEERYSFETRMQKIRALYDQLLGGPAPPLHLDQARDGVAAGA
jgi:glycosyltransferase involved in cell wall biosynthesis